MQTHAKANSPLFKEDAIGKDLHNSGGGDRLAGHDRQSVHHRHAGRAVVLPGNCGDDRALPFLDKEGRGVIRQKLADGWNEQQIKDYFVEQYGARVLATPPAEGLNWLVYVLPPVAFLSGATMLFRALRSWRRAAETAPASPAGPAASDDPYVQQLEEELRRRG